MSGTGPSLPAGMVAFSVPHALQGTGGTENTALHGGAQGHRRWQAGGHHAGTQGRQEGRRRRRSRVGAEDRLLQAIGLVPSTVPGDGRLRPLIPSRLAGYGGPRRDVDTTASGTYVPWRTQDKESHHADPEPDQAPPQEAIGLFTEAGIVLSPAEREQIEIADFGLGQYAQTGLAVLVYVNTARCCGKELAMLAGQTCPSTVTRPLTRATPARSRPSAAAGAGCGCTCRANGRRRRTTCHRAAAKRPTRSGTRSS